MELVVVVEIMAEEVEIMEEEVAAEIMVEVVGGIVEEVVIENGIICMN